MKDTLPECFPGHEARQRDVRANEDPSHLGLKYELPGPLDKCFLAQPAPAKLRGQATERAVGRARWPSEGGEAPSELDYAARSRTGSWT